jgi:membrane fusion protein
MDKTALFRQEALKSNYGGTEGPIRIDQSLQSWVTMTLAVIIVFALTIFVTFGKFAQKVKVFGVTVPTDGSIEINAPNDGVLQKNFVNEEQLVRLGQPLFLLSTEREQKSGEYSDLIKIQLNSKISSLKLDRTAKIQREREQSRNLKFRILEYQQEIVQAEQELDFAKERADLALHDLENSQTLRSGGFLSVADERKKRDAYLDASARQNGMRRTLADLKLLKRKSISDLSDISKSLESDLAQSARDIASVNQELIENQKKKSLIITSPSSGKVSLITYSSGQTVSGGQHLATLIKGIHVSELTRLEVNLFAPSKAIGFICAGQPVHIRFHAFPYQKYGFYTGHISDIASTPFAPSEIPSSIASTVLSLNKETGTSSEALYRIKVRLDPIRLGIETNGIIQKLKPGMSLDADIIQDNRRIWEWIIAPLSAKS